MIIKKKPNNLAIISLLILWTMVAPNFAIKIVIGMKIKNAGTLIKPILKGIFVFINKPERKKPKHPKTDIKKPIDAALPIDLFIVYPTNFNIGTFIIAPPMPINEDTKPTVIPRIVLWIRLNFNFILVLSFKSIKLIANK